MYTPEYFTEDDPDRISELLGGYGFGLVVTVDAEGSPYASHLPLLHDPGSGRWGTILGHMARATPQWSQFSPERYKSDLETPWRMNPPRRHETSIHMRSIPVARRLMGGLTH